MSWESMHSHLHNPVFWKGFLGANIALFGVWCVGGFMSAWINQPKFYGLTSGISPKDADVTIRRRNEYYRKNYTFSRFFLDYNHR